MTKLEETFSGRLKLNEDQVGTIRIPLQFDYTQKVETTYLYTFLDVLEHLGATYAAYRWCAWLVFPFVCLSFLHSLASALITRYEKEFRAGLEDLAHKSILQLLKIKQLSKSDDSLTISEDDL